MTHSYPKDEKKDIHKEVFADDHLVQRHIIWSLPSGPDQLLYLPGENLYQDINLC